MTWGYILPVTQGEILAAANLNKHQLSTEQQLPHDVSEETGVHLWIGQFTRQRATVADELMTTGCLVTVQRQDCYAEVRTGSLEVLAEDHDYSHCTHWVNSTTRQLNGSIVLLPTIYNARNNVNLFLALNHNLFTV